MKKRRKSAPEEVLWSRRDRGPSPGPAPDPVVAPPRLWKQPPLPACHHFKWSVQAAEMLRFQSLCLPSPVYYCCSLFHYEELRVCYLVFESHWWSRSRERCGWCDLTPHFFFLSDSWWPAALCCASDVNENGDAVNETNGFLHLKKKKKKSEKWKPFALAVDLFSITCPVHVNSVSVGVLEENSWK